MIATPAIIGFVTLSGAGIFVLLLIAVILLCVAVVHHESHISTAILVVVSLSLIGCVLASSLQPHL